MGVGVGTGVGVSVGTGVGVCVGTGVGVGVGAVAKPSITSAPVTGVLLPFSRMFAVGDEKSWLAVRPAGQIAVKVKLVEVAGEVSHAKSNSPVSP